MQLECKYAAVSETPGVVSLRRASIASTSTGHEDFAVPIPTNDRSDGGVSDRSVVGGQSTSQTSSPPQTIDLSPSHSPILRNVSSLSMIPFADTASDLGTHMRLFHHFTSVIVPELESRSPFLEVTAGIWRSDISAMSFGKDSLLHSLLALAAQDLAFRKHEVDKSTELLAVHEGQALSAITTDLRERTVSVPTFMSVLLLIWLSLVSNRLETATQHLEGLQSMIDQLPASVFSTGPGREVAKMFIALDVTRAAVRATSTRPLTPITTWFTHQLRLTESISVDSQLMYELLEILSRTPMTPDLTFLEIASGSVPIPDDFLLTIDENFENLRLWRQRTKQSRSFDVVDYCAASKEDHGYIIYATPEAALQVAHYFMGLMRVNSDWRLDPTQVSVETKAARFIRQIVNGAMLMYPSEYSARILDVKIAMNIFRPLFACNDSTNFTDHREWEDRLFQMAGHDLHGSVLNLNSPWIFIERRKVEDVFSKYLGRAGLHLSSKMGPPNVRSDFRMHQYYIPYESDGQPKPTSFYCVYRVDPSSFRVLVVNQTTLADSLDLTPDWETTAYWNMLVEKHTPAEPLAPSPIRSAIDAKLEALVDLELEHLQDVYEPAISETMDHVVNGQSRLVFDHAGYDDVQNAEIKHNMIRLDNLGI